MKISQILAGIVLGSAVPAASAQTVIKFSHVVAVDTPKGKAAVFFAQKASELTKGNGFSCSHARQSAARVLLGKANHCDAAACATASGLYSRAAMRGPGALFE